MQETLFWVEVARTLISFDIEEFRKHYLVNGLDDIGLAMICTEGNCISRKKLRSQCFYSPIKTDTGLNAAECTCRWRKRLMLSRRRRFKTRLGWMDQDA
jgi:hypothetical protein